MKVRRIPTPPPVEEAFTCEQVLAAIKNGTITELNPQLGFFARNGSLRADVKRANSTEPLREVLVAHTLSGWIPCGKMDYIVLSARGVMDIVTQEEFSNHYDVLDGAAKAPPVKDTALLPVVFAYKFPLRAHADDVAGGLVSSFVQFLANFGQVIIRKHPEISREHDYEHDAITCTARFRVGLDPAGEPGTFVVVSPEASPAVPVGGAIDPGVPPGAGK